MHTLVWVNTFINMAGFHVYNFSFYLDSVSNCLHYLVLTHLQSMLHKYLTKHLHSCKVKCRIKVNGRLLHPQPFQIKTLRGLNLQLTKSFSSLARSFICIIHIFPFDLLHTTVLLLELRLDGDEIHLCKLITKLRI
jgi:hypothetical protein